MLRLFANFVWTKCSAVFQLRMSNVFSRLFRLRLSTFVIVPYCMALNLGPDYLNQFEPDSGERNYTSYYDFFKRRYRVPPRIDSHTVWPCEGYICDWGPFSGKNHSLVKGQKIDLNDIFLSQDETTRDHYFVNVFLHNHNYHRIHSPVDGTLLSVKRIRGELLFLRPWFYPRGDVSYPAFKNERVVFEIRDRGEKTWYLALVGGFGVGTIETHPDALVGAEVKLGQEIGSFNLGSTVCIAAPYPMQVSGYLQTIAVGERIVLS